MKPRAPLKPRAGLLAAFACTFLGTGVAHASGGGDNALADIGWYTLNFVILVVTLVYFARKPLQSFFADRRTQIQDQLSHAADTLAESERRHKTLQRQLVDLDRDLEEIRIRASERTESERERILADAHAAARRIENDAKAAVEREVEQAREQLRQEASELAIEIATTRLQGQINDGDRDRLIDEFVDHIESSNPASTNTPERTSH